MDKKFAFRQLDKLRHCRKLAAYHFIFSGKDQGYSVNKNGHKIKIAAASDADLLRAYNSALGLIKQHKDGQLKYSSNFSDVIAMLDLARNAVLSVKSLKKVICRLAGLGYSEIWLYLEDEFEIPGEPYFGLQRGRYSQHDLHDLAIFADRLGITLVPAIQTLAHLKNVLKWENYHNIRDTADNLYVGKKETYTFIEKELKAATAPFLTNKVHIGMDEAYDLGLGKYFFDNHNVDQHKLITQHANMVFKLCNKLRLKPMMWSDMWFEIGSPIHMMYDPKANVKDFGIDRKIGQVYWDYYSDDVNHYVPVIKKHFELSDNIYFAMGIWIWGRLAPNQSKMLRTIKAGMQAAKETGIKKVVATAWRDDGGETPFAASYLGWQVFADYQYIESPTTSDFEEDFKLLQDEDYDSYSVLDEFDNLENRPNIEDTIPSKLLFYEDLIQPRYYQNLKDTDFTDYYNNLKKKLSTVISSKNSTLMFSYYEQLAAVLSKKAHLLSILSKNECSIAKITQFKRNLNRLAKIRRKLWFKENKENGSELLDIRFGGLIQRTKTVKYLLKHNNYQMDIPDVKMDKHIKGKYGNALYREIVSPSEIS